MKSFPSCLIHHKLLLWVHNTIPIWVYPCFNLNVARGLANYEFIWKTCWNPWYPEVIFAVIEEQSSSANARIFSITFELTKPQLLNFWKWLGVHDPIFLSISARELCSEARIGWRKDHKNHTKLFSNPWKGFRTIFNLWDHFGVHKKCNVPNLARFGTLQRSDVSFWFKQT